MRKQIAEELPFAIEAELVPMIDKSSTFVPAPMVRFPDLKPLVMHNLDQHEKAGSRTWHAALPTDEVWVKIGGGGGGGMVGEVFQVELSAGKRCAP